MAKTRRNITMNNETWTVLNELKKVLDKSISEIVEEAVLEYLKKHKFNSLYFKLMTAVSPCDEKENEELTKILDNLTEKDLEVVEIEGDIDFIGHDEQRRFSKSLINLLRRG